MSRCHMISLSLLVATLGCRDKHHGTEITQLRDGGVVRSNGTAGMPSGTQASASGTGGSSRNTMTGAAAGGSSGASAQSGPLSTLPTETLPDAEIAEVALTANMGEVQQGMIAVQQARA